MKLKFIAIAVISLAITYPSSPIKTAFAEGDQPATYQKTFTITAYYSPIAGQKRYIKGSLERDKALNGNGTHGADGTPVYYGMVAAPKEYAFGTKMEIPGIGLVGVHDRGGAIKSSNGKSYDRLDIWMGEGDDGLTRALTWGKRNVTVTVYGLNSSLQENVNLNSYDNEDNSPDITPAMMFPVDLGYGAENNSVKSMQEGLSKIGLYSGNIDGKFYDDTYNAVSNFQIGYGIIESGSDFGAGYFGPQTRQALEKAINDHQNKSTLTVANAAPTSIYSSNTLQDLKNGDSGPAVIALQQELQKLNLFGLETTGYYGDVTAHAVFKFQQINGLAGDENSPGAGTFGPITRNKLNSIIASRQETQKLIAEKNNGVLVATNSN